MNFKPNKKTFLHLFFLLAGIVLFAWILFNLSDFTSWVSGILQVFTPLILGFCMAFAINVPMKFLERYIMPNTEKQNLKTIRRVICLLIALVIVLTILAIVFILVIPEFINAIVLLVNSIITAAPQAYDWFLNNTALSSEIETVISSLNLDIAKISSDLLAYVTNSASTILGSAFTLVTSITGGVANFFIAFIFALYILFGKEKLKHQFSTLFHAIFPDKVVGGIAYIARETSDSFAKFITGQCTEACILGLLSFVGMTIFGFPYATMISALVGVLALIPIVGAISGSIIGAFMILLVDPLQALWFILYSIALQQFEGNVIYPRVVGTSVGLPGIWVLAAITVAGSLFGMVGMLVAVPICSVIYSLTKQIAKQGVAKKELAKKAHEAHVESKTYIKDAIVSVISEDYAKEESIEKAQKS